MIDIYAALEPFSVNKCYLKRYVDFIQSRPRHVDCVVESHHILPKAKSMFPQYEFCEWNLINLSLREHFIAHWMLKRAVGGPMICAYNFMVGLKKYRVTSHAYAEGRYAFKHRTISAETRSKISKAGQGRIVSEETRAKIGKFNKGKFVTDETRKKMSIAAKIRGISHVTRLRCIEAARNPTDATRLKMSKSASLRRSTPQSRAKASAALMGRVFSEETKSKISAAALNRPTVKCPHCDKVGQKPSMKRWHFDNCKNKNQKSS